MTDEPRRWFADTINRSIPVDSICAEIVDTPAFQRLRKIKQLSLMDYVFAGAEHSRFNHSLGVMYNAAQMTDRLGVTGRDRRSIIIAALLHDIGHYPLSHIGEWAFQTAEDQLDVNRDDDPVDENHHPETGNILWPYWSKPRPNREFHEALGARIVTTNKGIANVLARNGVDPQVIAQLITGRSENILYNQILHSNLDADRLDYLLRDSLQSGVTYGHVDKDYLIRMMRRGRHTVKRIGGTEETQEVLCIRRKGVHALEHFVLARYFHYSQVVYHKTIAAFEVIAKALIGQLVLRENGRDRPRRFPKNHKEVEDRAADDLFLTRDFVDAAVIQRLYELREALRDTKDPAEKDLIPLIDCLLERRRPRVLFERATLARAETEDHSDVKRLERLLERPGVHKELANRLGVSPNHVGRYSAATGLESSYVPLDHAAEEDDEKLRDSLRVLEEPGSSAKFATEERSSLLSVVSDMSYKVVRVFYLPPTDHEPATVLERERDTRTWIQQEVARR